MKPLTAAQHRVNNYRPAAQRRPNVCTVDGSCMGRLKALSAAQRPSQSLAAPLIRFKSHNVG
eukprot:10973117-Alexandrium_andersonii.AAC.1